MRGALLGWVCIGLFCTAGVAWGGEAGDVEALKKQLAELKEKENAVRAKRDALRAEMRKSPELAPLREAYDKAQAVYQEKKKTDEAYSGALKAEAEAREAFGKLVKEKLDADADAKRIREDLDSIKQKTPDDKEAIREAQKKLDEARRRIEKGDDPDVKAAREKRDAARTAREEAYKGEALVPLREARNQAREAYEAKRRELEKANPDLLAALKEREEVRVQVRELEKKLEEALAAQK